MYFDEWSAKPDQLDVDVLWLIHLNQWKKRGHLFSVESAIYQLWLISSNSGLPRAALIHPVPITEVCQTKQHLKHWSLQSRLGEVGGGGGGSGNVSLHNFSHAETSNTYIYTFAVYCRILCHAVRYMLGGLYFILASESNMQAHTRQGYKVLIKPINKLLYSISVDLRMLLS